MKIKFDIKSELPFKKRRKGVNTLNDEMFVDWIIRTIKKHFKREQKPNEIFNALCISMNKTNIDYIHDFINPLTFLNYAPVEDNSLGDDEYSIDLDKLTEVRV